jgi:hypothetical protein
MELEHFHSKYVVLVTTEEPVEAVISVDTNSGKIANITELDDEITLSQAFPDWQTNSSFFSFGDLVIMPGVGDGQPGYRFLLPPQFYIP